MSTTHTPGPWRAFYNRQTKQLELGRPSTNGLEIVEPVAVLTTSITKENLDLIEAAPELLEALQHALQAWESYSETGFPNPNLRKYQTAIAKATGGET